jgi:pyridoxal phosphate enzyme (YggS family)
MPQLAEVKVGVRERLQQVTARIDAAARAAGRDPKEVLLIAVSKTHPPDLVREAIKAGVTDLGENRVQEGESKILSVGRERAKWHLIGHLQANKARKAVQLFDMVHSLDSASLARRLNRLCEEEERDHLRVLVQVDLGNEESKTGIGIEKLPELIRTLATCERLRLEGLMTLPPFIADPEEVRPYFQRLREMRDELQKQNAFGEKVGELSMGMSHDFEVAIREGATMVRVGTAIFGERGTGEL